MLVRHCIETISQASSSKTPSFANKWIGLLLSKTNCNFIPSNLEPSLGSFAYLYILQNFVENKYCENCIYLVILITLLLCFHIIILYIIIIIP